MEAIASIEMEAPKSQAAFCPGCGKAIDPLRAGHVAIIDGGFQYFCGPACKRAYAEVSSKRSSLDALTADPLPVVSSGPIPRYSASLPDLPRPPARHEAPREVAPVTSPSPTFPPPPPPSPTFPPPPPPRPPSLHGAYDPPEESVSALPEEPSAPDRGSAAGLRSVTEPSAPPDEEMLDASDDELLDEGPRTLRSSALGDAPRSAPPVVVARPLGRRLLGATPALGIGAGFLAAVVSLAGEGAAALRLPLALFAVVMALAQSVFGARDRADVPRLLLLLPILASAVVACVTVAVHPGEPSGGAAAVYTGLAAAAALVATLLVERARRDFQSAQLRVRRALAVTVRVSPRSGAPDGAGEQGEVPADQVKAGEEIVVGPGEVIGVDGVVAKGSAEIAPWLDAKVVLPKREGDAVVAGASVVSGQLRVTATFTGRERAWLRFTDGGDGRAGLPPMVLLARRVAEPAMPLAALVVGAATYANNAPLPEVMLAACAGAYALAATMAVTVIALAHHRGLQATQQRGIVYRDARAFDTAARADVAVVCSRGTVLLGEPEIVAAEEASGKNTERVLALAAGAEMAASDAVARAVLREARARNVRPENVRSALVHPGLGVTALVASGDKVVVGSRAFLLEEKVSVALLDGRVNELEAQGRSVLLVAVAGRLVGLLALQDGLRPGARAAIQRMHDARIEPVLLSGEARDTCETIARALDIEHVRPEILPADRGAEVRALADGGHVIAAVGHATSDDDALGAADVSVAMGAAGLSPGEWGVALASDDVRDAALALTVPRACRDRAKTAALACAGAQVVSSLGIAFGLAPPVIAPVVGLLAAFVGLAWVREPTTTKLG